MATWFSVIGRIAQTEGIADSCYRNALIEFEEGNSDESSCRSFYVAFWGDLLLSGRCYFISGIGRLTGNENCAQPKVRFLSYLYQMTVRLASSRCIQYSLTYTVHIDISLLLHMRSLWYWTNCQSII